MDRFVDALLVRLINELSNHGSWCGETHIQKATYFLQTLFDTPLDFEFVLYKHGPYSFGLSSHLTSMRGDLLLDLDPKPAPYGPSYVPTTSGERILRRHTDIITKLEPQIQYVAQALGRCKVTELEELATALFVSTYTANTCVENRASDVHELKPHISMERASEAVQRVDEIVHEASAKRLVTQAQ